MLWMSYRGQILVLKKSPILRLMNRAIGQRRSRSPLNIQYMSARDKRICLTSFPEICTKRKVLFRYTTKLLLLNFFREGQKIIQIRRTTLFCVFIRGGPFHISNQLNDKERINLLLITEDVTTKDVTTEDEEGIIDKGYDPDEEID